MNYSKCRVCGERAIIDLPRHNANFCGEHLLQLCRRQVEKAIKDHDMLSPDDRILVAVSGGKDSLAVWDILLELGYQADGLYIGLGIGEYSDVSGDYSRAFADERGLTLQHGRPARRVRLRRPDGGEGHQACAVLGLWPVETSSLRQGGARRRLRRGRHRPQPRRRGGGAVRQRAAVGRRVPRPPAPRPAGPQRVPEEGQAAHAPDRAGDGGVVHRPRHRLPGRGVPDGARQQAPRVQGRAELDRTRVARIEVGVLPRASSTRCRRCWRSISADAAGELVACTSCGAPTTEPDSGDDPVCAFCRLQDRVGGVEPVPVEMVLNKKARKAYLAGQAAGE